MGEKYATCMLNADAQCFKNKLRGGWEQNVRGVVFTLMLVLFIFVQNGYYEWHFR